MARRVILSSCLIIVLGTGIAYGQPSAPASTDPRLREVVAAVESAAERSGFKTHALWPELKVHLDVLRSSGRMDMRASEIASAALGQRRAAAIARAASGTIPPAMAAALEGMRGIAGNELRELLQTKEGRDAATQALWPLTALHAQLLDLSLAESLEKLRRYERKFGPKSARLNTIEVGANFLMQRVRGFGPDDEGWPGPWEVIAAYSPTYLTIEVGEPVLASVGEAGLRRYFFDEDWGANGWKGMLRPAFMTAGIAVASEQSGPLKSPWRGDSSIGAFVSWGELKVAFAGGRNRRLFVSRQFQIIPLGRLGGIF